MNTSYNNNYGTGTAASRVCFAFVAKAPVMFQDVRHYMIFSRQLQTCKRYDSFAEENKGRDLYSNFLNAF